jgi:hypothetical protein
MISVDFFIVALGSTQPLTEMSTRNISWGVKYFLWQPTTLMCRLSRNLGTPTSWNPKGLSRPVMGLLYLLPQSALNEFCIDIGTKCDYFPIRN